MKPNNSFWKGKKVLITGHSGFKGSWLALWLHYLGAKVTGISLPPCTDPNLFTLAKIDEVSESHFLDIREIEELKLLVQGCQPDLVFHLAAQPLVRASYRNPIETFSSNIMGTANVLDSLRGSINTKVAVIVTTDKVYEDQGWTYPYRENDILGGYDPYSASKAASEIVTNSYRESFFRKQGLAIATARAGNVIGGGDWSEDRLIPDAIRSWQVGRKIEIRNPEAVRPWQHVLEPLSAYLLLAEKIWHQPDLAGAYNFGPDTSTTATVKKVIESARNCFGKGEILFGDNLNEPHETNMLSLDISKASSVLGVRPVWSLSQAINYTMGWYSKYGQGADCRELCLTEISDYEALT